MPGSHLIRVWKSAPNAMWPYKKLWITSLSSFLYSTILRMTMTKDPVSKVWRRGFRGTNKIYSQTKLSLRWQDACSVQSRVSLALAVNSSSRYSIEEYLECPHNLRDLQTVETRNMHTTIGCSVVAGSLLAIPSLLRLNWACSFPEWTAFNPCSLLQPVKKDPIRSDLKCVLAFSETPVINCCRLEPDQQKVYRLPRWGAPGHIASWFLGAALRMMNHNTTPSCLFDSPWNSSSSYLQLLCEQHELRETLLDAH
jgi:hypothetical protein